MRLNRRLAPHVYRGFVPVTRDRHGRHRFGGPGNRGAYSPEFTHKVYDEVTRRADAVLRSGRTVILDASFRSAETRAAARRLAERHRVPFDFVECRAEPQICRQRLREREHRTGISDGRLAIFDDFVAQWQPVDELMSTEHSVIDTSAPLENNLEILRPRLGGWPERVPANS